MNRPFWKFSETTKKHTQDGPNLVRLMKSIGKGQRPVRAIDIGCGDGIIAYEILEFHKATHVVAIEIQKEAAAIASQNLSKEIEKGRAEVLKTSVQKYFKNKKKFGSFDRVVINPPFFRDGSGPENKKRKDQMARHEASLKLKTWVKGSAKLLKTGGELYCVFPTERMSELFSELSKNSLEPKEIWWFKNDLRKRRFFLRAMRDARPGIIVNFDF